MRKVKRTVPKQKIKDFGTIFFVIIIFPYIINLIFHGISSPEKKKVITNDTVVIVKTNIGYEKIPLEKYLVGALAASICTDYEEEALKAQTVLLRTAVIAERIQASQTDNKVYQEKIKQPYFSAADMQEQYGENFEETYVKLKKTVEATEGIILTYQGKIIETPFCASTGGRTRSGEEAFGNKSYPYLKSVVCESDILAENYIHTYKFSWNQLSELLSLSQAEMLPSKTTAEDGVSGNVVSKNEVAEDGIMGKEDKIVIEKTDAAGYARIINVDGKKFVGEEFRKKLRLSSSNLSVGNNGKEVIIRTKGVGHGVGMSQYTANHLAKNGDTFIEILSYFFTDTEIEKN